MSGSTTPSLAQAHADSIARVQQIVASINAASAANAAARKDVHLATYAEGLVVVIDLG